MRSLFWRPCCHIVSDRQRACADGLVLIALQTVLLACGTHASVSADSAALAGTSASPNAPLVPNATSDCVLGQQDGNGLGGPSICCAKAYAVCDDFEAQSVGQSPNAAFWEVENLSSSYGRVSPLVAQSGNTDAAATIAISADRSARGKQSLHIRAQNSASLPNGGWHHNMLVNRSIFPAPNNTFWGRAFLYFVDDQNTSAVPGGHATYADASGTVTGSSTFYTWWRVSTFGSLALNCEHGDQGVGSSQRLPTNRWACLEWHYQGDANNSVVLYVDGNQIAATTSSTATADNPAGHAPAYDAFRFGWEVYGYQYNPTPQGFEMYYDEVVLDYNRVGCIN